MRGFAGAPMAHDDEQEQHERIFTLSEANRLIPQLNSKLTSIQQAKAVLARTKEDIKKASAQAEYGGGSTVGHLYISGLQQVSTNLQAIQELGILVKDLDLGLCDFPIFVTAEWSIYAGSLENKKFAGGMKRPQASKIAAR